MIDGVIDNKHFHSGVAVSDLYIEAKYGSFKEEWQNYAHLNVQQAESAMTKANEFMKSEKVKEITAEGQNGGSQTLLHYDIAFGAALSLWHILSLVL